MRVKLAATVNASQRTKNRIREHGPVFEWVEERRTDLFGGGVCMLVRVISGSWLGWLPKDEIIVKKWLDNES
jgi:hypothetical protein